MRVLTTVLAMVWLASLSATAAEQPEYPGLDLPETYVIILKSREVPNVIWRNGRPFAPRDVVGPRLNLPAGGDPYVDLLAAARARGYEARLELGSLILTPPASASTDSSAPATAGMSTALPRSGPRWVHSGSSVAETGKESQPTRVMVDRLSVRGNSRYLQFTCRFNDEEVLVSVDLTKGEYQSKRSGYWSDSTLIPPDSLIEGAIQTAREILEGRL